MRGWIRAALVLSLGPILGCEAGDKAQHQTEPMDAAAYGDAGSIFMDAGDAYQMQGEDASAAVLLDMESTLDQGGHAPDTQGMPDVGAQADSMLMSTADTGSHVFDVGSAKGDAGREPAMRVLRPGIQEFSINQTVDGVEIQRRVIVHAPADLVAGGQYPAVLAFHGNGGRPDGFVGQMRQWVEQGRFVGVYPEGYQRSWNLGQERSHADEIDFIDQVMLRLNQYPHLRDTRRLGFGSSNGAGMIHELAIRTQYFEAVVALSTALIVGREPGAQTAPVSIMQVHGIDDQVCPYGGGASPTGHVFHPAEESISIWGRHNDCQVQDRGGSAHANVRINYLGCRDGHRVVHYGIPNVGHGLPPDTEGGLMALVLDFLGVMDGVN